MFSSSIFRRCGNALNLCRNWLSTFWTRPEKSSTKPLSALKSGPSRPCSTIPGPEISARCRISLNCRAFNEILHLADISGPGIVLHGLDGPLFNADNGFVELFSGLVQKVLSQFRHRFSAFPQRRKIDEENIQAII